MNDTKRRTLYQRIFFPFGIAVAVTAASAWLAATFLLGQSLERDLANRMNYTLDLIAAKSLPLTPELLSRVAQLHQAELTLVDVRGQITFTTLPKQGQQDRQLASLWRESEVGASFPATYDGTRYLAITRALDPSSFNGNGGIMMLSSLQAVTDAGRNTAFGIAAITLLVMGILAWWGHRVSQSITRPISALASMATAIAEGDRTVRVDASSIRELATLTTTLNGMTDRLQEYEHQLATKNRLAALGELAERVAHEIRNPITAIKLHMQILAERLAGSDLQQTPNQLLIEIARLEMVVSNTLALGKPMSIQRDWVQVEQVLTDVVMLMQPSISHRGIELQWQQPGALPAVALDADRFKQVVYNLLTNAADALDGRGVVRITAIHNQLENVLEIRFEDSGPGFSAAAISNLERRLSQSTKPNGSGVGLLLSLELVELHGGTLTIGTSETLTGGLVVVKLPLIAADEDIQLPVAARPS